MLTGDKCLFVNWYKDTYFFTVIGSAIFWEEQSAYKNETSYPRFQRGFVLFFAAYFSVKPLDKSKWLYYNKPNWIWSQYGFGAMSSDQGEVRCNSDATAITVIEASCFISRNTCRICVASGLTGTFLGKEKCSRFTYPRGKCRYCTFLSGFKSAASLLLYR